jgi:hypothetical protein
MRRLIGKAHEERAEFPLEVAVTNAKGEAWSAIVTIKGGGECEAVGCLTVREMRTGCDYYPGTVAN